MGRAPSEKTQEATARREIARLRAELMSTMNDMNQYRRRATVAEQAVVEWKARFDELLKLRVDVPRTNEHG